MTNSNSAFTNWGYKYINAASDRFIGHIEGPDALNAYPEFRDRHIRADELISELLGSEPCLFYIRRQGEARNPEHEILELTIATDRDDFPMPAKLQERQKTLQFWASVHKEGTGYLGLKNINFVDPEKGQIDAFSSAWLIRLLPDVVQDIGIPQEAFAQIATMPVCGPHVPTTEQIRVWEQYLDIERRIANKRQFCVPFVNYNYQPSRQRIIFTLNVDLATSNGSVSLTPEEFWQRAEARNGSVKLFENSAELGNRDVGQELGNIETVESNKNQIKIQLNSNLVDSLSSGNLELPTTGFLFFEDGGSLAQISWKKQALNNLKEGKGHTQNRYLGEFFFDAAKARPIPATSPLSKTDLLLSEANETQIAAVEAVLAAEDLILIQGPPGTGKTTVIAEICYQVARRGGRTLVVSQANLAVDNALSRLTHHPVLRPLREEDARTRVGREGEPFLAHNVIDRWLEHTTSDCENRLSKQQKIVQGLHPLLTSIETFHAYVKTEMDFPLNHKILREDQTNLQEIRAHQNNNLEVVRMQYEQVNVLKIELERILESNSLFLAEQVKKLQQLKERQTEIASAINEHREWTNSANPNLYHLLKQSLQQRLFVTEDLIYLPKIGLTLVTQSQPNGLPWKETCDRLLGEINQLISQGKEWDEICQVANAIYWLILPCEPSIANQKPSQPHIDQYGSKLRGKIESNHPLVKIRKLYKLAKNLVDQLNQSDQQLYKNATHIKAIKQEYEILIDQNHPINTEKELNRIVADYVLEVKIKLKPLLQQLHSENYQKIKQLEIDIPKIEQTQSPFLALSEINNHFQGQLDELQNQIQSVLQTIAKSDAQIAECNNSIQRLQDDLNNQRNWWRNTWQLIPKDIKPDIPDPELLTPDFLTSIQQYFEPWQQQLTQAESYLNRYESTMQKWIDRLRNPSDTDLEAISKKYLENVNVVGITCMKAAKRSFSQKFSKFDLVIIDEVSQSTPPALLIPALKGKKVVMIGDYRQLPPILDEENLDELAEELSVPREKVQFLENSWFKQQFEAATSVQKGITQKLNIQYRMHPQIMEAINQFYNEGDGGLSCGLTDPDKQRAHHLEGELIQKDQHIIWVKIPWERRYQENKIGTSYENNKEVAIIEKLCEQMNKAWAAKVANGEPKKEIGIITFYGPQLRLIDKRISRTNRFPNLDIRTGTVDRFQGMEKSVVIVSMVRNNDRRIVGFAKTPERVNVAFSRAKELLVIVGCHDLFTSISIYKEVSKVVERYRGFIDDSSIL